jgi:hypothetical protein
MTQYDLHRSRLKDRTAVGKVPLAEPAPTAQR